MSASAACFILFIAGLSLGTSANSVGDCNMTYFISNGQQCQRVMIKNLQTKPNTNCSYEYEGEKSCLRKHIAGCLTNLPKFVDPVTSLLLHQAYHCGDVTYESSITNDLILNLIKCKSQAFEDTEFCWGYFRDRLNANRSDPLLCREYAVAKECITEKAKAYCKICEHLSRDTYNPFCPNNRDPALHTNGCQDLENPRLSCKTSSIYRTAADCENKFLKNFIGDEKPDCGTTYTALRACIDEQLSQTCKDYSNNQRLKSDIQKAVLAVLRGRRFFCEAVSLRTIDLDFKVRDLVPCNAEFFPAMEKCAKPIRMEYRANNTAGEFCRNFRTADDCSNVAQKLHCTFVKDVQIIIQDPYTLFCTNGTENETGRKNVSGAISISAGFGFTIFALVLQLLPAI